MISSLLLRYISISTHDLTRRSTLHHTTGSHQHLYFNSRPHEEVDRYCRKALLHNQHFNSRPREEVDISYCPRRAGLLLFQLTTSQGGRLIRSVNTANCLYFNSRPHEEVDAQGTGNGRHILISTHNLTRRSTDNYCVTLCAGTFQLTTSRGGRRISRMLPDM